MKLFWYLMAMNYDVRTCLAGMREMKLRSQVVQRDLPRPTEVNNAVMRPTPGPNDPPLSLLQKVQSCHVTGFFKKKTVCMLDNRAVATWMYSTVIQRP